MERLPAGHVITPDELMASLKKAKLQIEAGDVVLIRTGHGKLWMKDNQAYGEGEPGLGLAAAKYLTDHKVALIGADTWAIEAVPHENPSRCLENRVDGGLRALLARAFACGCTDLALHAGSLEKRE